VWFQKMGHHRTGVCSYVFPLFGSSQIAGMAVAAALPFGRTGHQTSHPDSYRAPATDTDILKTTITETFKLLMFDLYRMHPVASLQTILLPLFRLTQHRECITFKLFYFIKFTTCFDHFIWSSSGEYKMYNKCSLELQTILRQIWSHIYNDL
jgi:hypothetical protein